MSSTVTGNQFRRDLGPDLSVFPLALGGNVFGWTADETVSRSVLDAYVGGGGNFIDTADSYSFWVEGNQGGESETIIGGWLQGRTDRDDLVIATKVSQHPDFKGMAPATVRRGVEASLRRLGIEVIDLYYAHFDDETVPLAEQAEAMSRLVDEGKVRALGISNYSADRVREWLSIAQREGLHRPVALQPQYSLMERDIERDVLPLAVEEGLGVMPYYALARGFLTGKYTSGDEVDSPRAAAASAYLTARGRRVLQVLEELSSAHDAHPAAVALAWLSSHEGVVAPLASARNTDQLGPLMRYPTIQLTPEETARLDEASS